MINEINWGKGSYPNDPEAMAAALERNDVIYYIDGNVMTHIEKRCDGDYEVNHYPMDAIKDMLSEIEPEDGGVCTGSASAAINF